jgi:hypothetical protein
MSKNGKRLPVEVQNGTPVLPNDISLKIIDEIEQMKRAKLRPIRVEAKEDDFELQSIWPQLSKVLKWLIFNEVDKAIEVIKVVACTRKFELEKERERVSLREEREENERERIRLREETARESIRIREETARERVRLREESVINVERNEDERRQRQRVCKF